jgi:hypothetical protein
VFTSARAPLTEVGGDAACYFDPTGPELAAACIAAAWPDRASLAEAGLARAALWSPSLMLERYVGLYRQLG